MKKLSAKILISALMVAIFLAPVVPVVKMESLTSPLVIENVNAEELKDYSEYKDLLSKSKIEWFSSSQTTADFEIYIEGKKEDWEKLAYVKVDFFNFGVLNKNENSTVLVVFEDGNYISHYDLSGEILQKTSTSGLTPVTRTLNPPEYLDLHRKVVSNLTPGKTYTASLFVKAVESGIGGGIDLFGSNDKSYYNFGKPKTITFRTPAENEPIIMAEGVDAFSDRSDDTGQNSDSFGCSGLEPETWFTNCVALFLFKIIFVPLAEVARVAAMTLDFFVFYSTNSTSYSSAFVERGWSMVRDVANIFFIITLLYIAVKTVLGLNVSNNKKLIGMIVVIALVINFSLFTTKVVIDASNILAKIFYNNITSVDESKNEIENKETGEKTISVGLVAQFNPHTMIVGTPANNLGQFVVVTILSIMLVGYMIYIFISVAMLFVARVVGLWLAMIFSPIAFISYAVPFKIPEFGHDEWWKKLIENAMLAPIFIFFLYIIIMFGDFFHLIKYDVAESVNWLDAIMKTLIPFAIVFVLLQQAKKLAVKYAGEIGAMLNKAGAAVGGLALGAVGAGTGLALSGTLGKIASKVASNEKLKELSDERGLKGWGSRMALRAGDYGSKASFDVRKSPVGSLIAKTGINLNASKAIGLGGDRTTGGYKGTQERKAKKLEKEYELQKTTMSDDEVKVWSKGKYSTAAELNGERMKNFVSNLGKTGLVYSFAYDTAKNTRGLVDENNYQTSSEYKKKENKWQEQKVKELKNEEYIKGRALNDSEIKTFESKFNKKIAEDINNSRVQEISIPIKIIGGLGIGAATGGLGLAGAAVQAAPWTTVAGSALAGLGAAGSYFTRRGAEASIQKKFGGELKKEHKGLEEYEKTVERREDLENLMKEMKSELEKANDIAQKNGGKQQKMGEYIKDGLINTKQKIDTLKGTENALRNERIRLESLDPIGNKRRIDELLDKEKAAAAESLKYMKEEFNLAQAKDAEEKISKLKEREDALLKSLSHESHSSYKEGKIAEAKSGGGTGGGEHKSEPSGDKGGSHGH